MRLSKTGNPRNPPWPPERKQELLKLVAQNRGYPEIARMLGVTVNAAIGMAHRLGLKNPHNRLVKTAFKPVPAPQIAPVVRFKPNKPPAPPKTVLRKGAVKKTLVVRMKPDSQGFLGSDTLWAGRGISLEDASGKPVCRWPFNSARIGNPRCCGQPYEVGPYCPAHAAISYQPQTKRLSKEWSWG